MQLLLQQVPQQGPRHLKVCLHYKDVLNRPNRAVVLSNYRLQNVFVQRQQLFQAMRTQQLLYHFQLGLQCLQVSKDYHHHRIQEESYRNRKQPLCLLFCMYRAFIVDRKSRKSLQIIIFPVCVVRASRLVAKAPHHYGRVHLVTLIHPRSAVNIMRLPLRVVAYAVVARREPVHISTVCFEIHFIYYIDTQFITDLQKIWVRWIVRSPDRIYVVLLAELHVALYLIRRQRIAVLSRSIMVIHSVEFNKITVHQELVASYFDRSESYALLHTAALDLVVHVVEFGCLIAPLYRRKGAESHLRCGKPALHKGASQRLGVFFVVQYHDGNDAYIFKLFEYFF